jgi:hypothetical protein
MIYGRQLRDNSNCSHSALLIVVDIRRQGASLAVGFHTPIAQTLSNQNRKVLQAGVKENTPPPTAIFLASQPHAMSESGFDRPHDLLGWFGSPLLTIFIAVGNEACLFRNQ